MLVAMLAGVGVSTASNGTSRPISISSTSASATRRAGQRIVRRGNVYDRETVRFLLREWSFFFMDRVQRGHAGSIESFYSSPQVWHARGPRPPYEPLRADTTWMAVRSIPVPLYRAVTVHYCLARFPEPMRRRLLGNRLGRKLNGRAYDSLVTTGESEVASELDRMATASSSDRFNQSSATVTAEGVPIPAAGGPTN